MSAPAAGPGSASGAKARGSDVPRRRTTAENTPVFAQRLQVIGLVRLLPDRWPNHIAGTRTSLRIEPSKARSIRVS